MDTFYAIPEGILEYDTSYIIRLIANDTGDGTSTLNRSSTYFDFSTGAAPAPVPEPSTWVLLGTGLAGLAFYRRKKS